jgi:DNA-binding NarL/FixJ family response regulator
MFGRRKMIRPDPWPFGRPRVLIEHADRETAFRYVDTLRRAGYSVAICDGPSNDRRPPERCVLVAGEPCAAVDGADVVVSGLGVHDAEKRAVLEALRRHHPDKALVVEVSPDDLHRYDDLVDGVHVVVSPVESEELVAAVGAAAAGVPA